MSDNTTSEVDTNEEATTVDESSAAPAPARSGRRQLLEREGEVAADFLETLLDIADLDGDIDLDIDGDRAAVAVVDSDEGRVPRRLVGQDGKVLEALQELTRLAVQSATGDRSRLMLDVAGHRSARRTELVEVAKAAVASVKDSGESVDLEPMTAFERKVVHDEVLASGLVSDSSGTEPRRFVVIHPADENEGGNADANSDATDATDADVSTEASVAAEAAEAENSTTENFTTEGSVAQDSAAGESSAEDPTPGV